MTKRFQQKNKKKLQMSTAVYKEILAAETIQTSFCNILRIIFLSVNSPRVLGKQSHSTVHGRPQGGGTRGQLPPPLEFQKIVAFYVKFGDLTSEVKQVLDSEIYIEWPEGVRSEKWVDHFFEHLLPQATYLATSHSCYVAVTPRKKTNNAH